jgi:hypothetical protein
MLRPNEYRTHTCGELRESDIGKKVRVSGWLENVRDHGGVKFADLRDQYGLVQVVCNVDIGFILAAFVTKHLYPSHRLIITVFRCYQYHFLQKVGPQPVSVLIGNKIQNPVA